MRRLSVCSKEATAQIQSKPTHQPGYRQSVRRTPSQEPVHENSSDLVYLYLHEISQTPLLKAEQEIQLTRTMWRGRAAALKLCTQHFSGVRRARLEKEMSSGTLARQALMQANLRLVVNLAKHYVGRGLTLLDLIQEGNLGLIRAVEKFDYRRGYKFSTHATWWIRQAITRALSNYGNSPRLPAHTLQWLRRLDRATRVLTQELARTPSDAEIAARLNVSVRQVRRLIQASAETWSLEMEFGQDQDATLGDFLEDLQTPTPWRAALETVMRDDLAVALDALSPREARVLILRFGLRDGYMQTLDQVGEKFGLTRERIRQIEKDALEKLRATPRAARLFAYLDTPSPTDWVTSRKPLL